MELPILSITIAIPLFSALFILLMSKQTNDVNKAYYIQYVAILAALLTFFCSLYLIFNYNDSTDIYNFTENHIWLTQLNFYYHIGADGLAISLIFLTTLLTLIAVVATLSQPPKRINEFLGFFLLIEAFTIGAFSALDILLFYIFFEATLIPMYLIIGIWGGENRIYAALKFFLYTLFGSVFLLCAIIYLYIETGSLQLSQLILIAPNLSIPIQQILFLAFFSSFAVKVPMFPLHTWLPYAHVEAPTSGSIILAGVLLKLGAYGFLRFTIPILPGATVFFAPLMIWLSIISVVYASIVAFAQTDMKKMIAYSSIAHMGYVIAGIFSLNQQGFDGAIFQMFSHGIISGALFLAVGTLYERVHTKSIAAYGGVANVMPYLAIFWFIFTMGSIGLPGTSGFIGEFLAIIGTQKVYYPYAFVIILGIAFGAVYMLSLYKNIMFGEIVNDNINQIRDLSTLEIILFLPLILIVIYLGISPTTLISFYGATVTSLLNILK